MQVADREHRLGALPGVLPDPDEDAGGERDREAAGVLDRPQPDGRDACPVSRSAGPRARESRSDDVSSISPIDALTCLSRASSS